jgi:phosphoheptose isomerase
MDENSEEKNATVSSLDAQENEESKQEKTVTVDELLSNGKRYLACGENQEAADCFEEACGQLLVWKRQGLYGSLCSFLLL